MLIASGRWRVFASAALTTLVIAGATALVFGPQVWIDFLTKGLAANNLVLTDPERIATPFYPTDLHEPARHRPAVQRRDGGAALRLGLPPSGSWPGPSACAATPIR